MNEQKGLSRTMGKVSRVVLVAGLCAVVALAGCSKHNKGGSQTAAKVNKEEITVHQINFALQQQRGLKPEQAEAAGRQVLERLIDQELAVQRAEEMKLDRDPNVMQQLEAVRREVLARAYAEKVSENAAKPTPDDLRKFYDEKPLLFKDRHIYSLQEIVIEAAPQQVPDLKAKMEAAKSIGEFVDYLKANDIKYTGSQGVRTPEQLPPQVLQGLSQMKDGQAVFTPTPTGAQVLVLAASRAQPVDFDRAKPAIEQVIMNDRKRDLVMKDIKELRAASKIEYVGKYAEGAASAPAVAEASSAAEPAPAAGPAPAAAASEASPASPASAGSLDASTISKGIK